MSSKINWEDIARNLLEQEKQIKQYNYPEPIGVILLWKGNNYIGSIQEIALGYSKEIILLSKSTSPLNQELVDAIKKLDNERLELCADETIDLGGRQHILRRLDNKLVYMTIEQTKYVTKNLPDIIEV